MRRKILLSIIGILIIICTILLSYEKLNKEVVEDNNGMFAIFLEEEKDTGRYQKSNLKTWPTEDEYTINMLKSYCENGSILRWNSETKKISLKVNGTDKCYVYFDKAEIGSAKHPHLIQTIEDLVRLSNDVNGGKTYTGEYFLLTNDLDFNDPSDYEDASRTDFQDINGINGNEALIKELTTGDGFVPIGEYRNNSFNGIILGNNHKIDNLYISRNAISVGFIGWGYTFKISNLTITGTIDSRASEDTAGLVARADGTNVIENVISDIKVNSLGTMGSFIGSNGSGANTTIINCQNKGTLNNNAGFLAGFVAWSNGKLTIKNSHNYADMTSNKSGHIGGLLGADGGSTNLTEIINSSNSGNIILNGAIENKSGGLIALVQGTLIMNKSYNLGNILKNDSQSGGTDGGLVGDIRNKTYIINSYNKGNINNNSTLANSRSSGLIGNVKDNSQTVLLNSYNAGDVTLPKEIDGTNYAVGIYMGDDASSNRTVTLNNVYNLGNLQAKAMWSIGNLPPIEKYNVNHTYYVEETNPGTQNVFTPLAQNTMKSSNFVDILNQNLASINLREIDESLKDYTLSKWKLGSDGYPTLDF